MNIKKILVIFKTHLDIGFTDFSADVIEGYMNNFIPSAIKTAQELSSRNSSASFRWTTGSWLIDRYLESADEDKKEMLENAIENGDICWHALPFTTHTEFMSKELFKYGLSLSQKLDIRFGRKTIGAKMTDVPGHTKAMIPLLSEAGIELLHIGVNPGSSVPEVPEIFRWRADSGEEITVIYNKLYGEFTPIGDTGTAIYFAHTNDNLGCQSADEIEEIFEEIRKEYPDAEIAAADLNDVALVVREIRDSLPVLTDEIGDSWIHGTGTDPMKVSQFRALERISEALPEGKDKDILMKGLLMIPEHTWGLDEKTHLHDNVNYSKSDFYAHRGDENYRKMEKSWAEQRNFMYDAAKLLSPETKEKCNLAMDEAYREPVDIKGMRKVEAGEIVKIDGAEFSFDMCGAIKHLVKNGKKIADENHRLFAPIYEQFSYNEYLRYHEKYNRLEVDWVWEDFTKIGMDNAADKYYSCCTSADVFADENKIVIKYKFFEKAKEEMGAPESADAVITVSGDEIMYDFAWFNKPANRIAEAIWLKFRPDAELLGISKLGVNIDPYHVVSKGNRNLHATDRGVHFDKLDVRLVDSALVSPGTPHLADFVNEVPAKDEGVYFNLYNNIWGTNFPMWYDNNSRFRFIIK